MFFVQLEILIFIHSVAKISTKARGPKVTYFCEE